MKNKDITPLVMGFLLVTGIIILAILRRSRIPGLWDGYPVDFDTSFIGLYLLWLANELRISKKDLNTEGKKTSDFMTCQFYGTGQALTVLTALWFPSVWRAPNAAHFAGMGLFLIGVLYRSWAIRTLGRFYSHRVRIESQHPIVASGPYRYTRHPAYAGMILANAGISLYFLNWVTTGVFLLVLMPAIVVRIAIEEKTLFEIAGYAEFAKNRKRLFPAVW